MYNAATGYPMSAGHDRPDGGLRGAVGNRAVARGVHGFVELRAVAAALPTVAAALQVEPPFAEEM